MALALAILACYLLGAIPTGYVAGRLLKGIDIRTLGSGNMGATNVFRVLGKWPGIFVLGVDMLKGYLAVVLAAAMLPELAFAQLLGGLAAVLGHNYTVFLGFKGGKGVATSAGVFLGLAPLATLSVLALFAVAFAASRMVSVGSLLAATALPVALCYYGEQGAVPPSGGAVFWLGIFLALFIWLRHIPNIRRIMAGTENKFGKKP